MRYTRRPAQIDGESASHAVMADPGHKTPGAARRARSRAPMLASPRGSKAGRRHLSGDCPTVADSAMPVFALFTNRLMSATSKRIFEAGATITPADIVARGLARSTQIKILGNGEITHQLTVQAPKFSQAARAKIEAAGGSVTEG